MAKNQQPKPPDLARRILRPTSPDDELKAYREAVLKAPNISDVYQHYRGENIPDDETFFRNTVLANYHIPEKSSSPGIQYRIRRTYLMSTVHLDGKMSGHGSEQEHLQLFLIQLIHRQFNHFLNLEVAPIPLGSPRLEFNSFERRLQPGEVYELQPLRGKKAACLAQKRIHGNTSGSFPRRICICPVQEIELPLLDESRCEAFEASCVDFRGF